MNDEIISSNVRKAYDHFYQTHDEAWRMLGAKYKAQNIIDVCGDRKFSKVLEVGAGDGSILYYLDQRGFASELYALEISESGVESIRSRNLKSLRSSGIFDGYHIPFSDDEFDLIILSHVLEHVEFERLLLRELKRVSKFQIIEVPKDYRYGIDKRMKHFLDYGHINMYTPTSLRFLLQSEGFRILNDKLSMIHPDVTKFARFVNQKQTRSFFKSLKIDLEYLTKRFIGSIAGKKKQEAFTNAYTVLTGKETDLHIF
jgi:ubiquinone/menaquinone biosynthesis C-methylase UbiE